MYSMTRSQHRSLNLRLTNPLDKIARKTSGMGMVLEKKGGGGVK